MVEGSLAERLEKDFIKICDAVNRIFSLSLFISLSEPSNFYGNMTALFTFWKCYVRPKLCHCVKDPICRRWKKTIFKSLLQRDSSSTFPTTYCHSQHSSTDFSATNIVIFENVLSK